MLEPEAISVWTEIKLQIIREYASAYTTILKERAWCRGYAYIDAFAGRGEFVSKEDRERKISGSPKNALEIQNKFTEYHFIDIDDSKIDQLKTLSVGIPEFQITRFHVGDANRILRSQIIPDFQYDHTKGLFASSIRTE